MYAVLFEAVFEYFYLFIGHKAVRNLILLCPFAFAEFMVGEDFHDRICHIHFFEQLKKDMEETFAVSREMTLEWCQKKFMRTNVIGPILKLFSPLL